MYKSFTDEEYIETDFDMVLKVPKKITFEIKMAGKIKNSYQITTDNFSRVRGGSAKYTTIIMSGNWSKNNTFGRCKFCNGLTIYGICQGCDFLRVCCRCKLIIRIDGSTNNIKHSSKNVSHGLCEKCLNIMRKEIK